MFNFALTFNIYSFISWEQDTSADLLQILNKEMLLLKTYNFHTHESLCVIDILFKLLKNKLTGVISKIRRGNEANSFSNDLWNVYILPEEADVTHVGGDITYSYTKV